MRHLIVGLGSIGKRHAQILLNRGEEVAGVDPYSTDHFTFPVYRQLDSAWTAKPDMVWICSPTHLHDSQAMEVLRRELHLFIEKPVAYKLSDAILLQNHWNNMSKKTLVWVACNMRFHPAVMKLKKFLDQGIIGRPLIYRFHFSHFLGNMRPGTDYHHIYVAHQDQGGGILLDDIHDIDLALWLSGPVRKIHGVALNSSFLGIQAEDIAHISMIHESGVLSEIHMDLLRKNRSRGIEIIGEKGTLEWRSLGKNPERASLKWYQDNQSRETELWQEELNNPDEMFDLQLEQILVDIHREGTYAFRLREAIDSLRIVHEVRKTNACAYRLWNGES